MKFCYCFDHQDGCNPRINALKGDYGRRDCCCCSDVSLKCYRLVKKIQSSRRDRENNRGDFLIFVFLMLVKLSYVCSEKPVHLSQKTVKCSGSQLIWTTLCHN